MRWLVSIVYDYRGFIQLRAFRCKGVKMSSVHYGVAWLLSEGNNNTFLFHPTANQSFTVHKVNLVSLLGGGWGWLCLGGGKVESTWVISHLEQHPLNCLPRCYGMWCAKDCSIFVQFHLWRGCFCYCGGGWEVKSTVMMICATCVRNSRATLSSGRRRPMKQMARNMRSHHMFSIQATTYDENDNKNLLQQ